MIKKPGHQPVASAVISGYYDKACNRVNDDVIVVHHVTEDTHRCLQLEIERRNSKGIFFERIIHQLY